MFINDAIIPNQCVKKCPGDTHENDQGYCRKGSNVVDLLTGQKTYNQKNVDYLSKHALQFSKILFPVNEKFTVLLWVSPHSA